MFTVKPYLTKAIFVTLLSTVACKTTMAQQLGRSLSEQEVKTLSQHVFPDGTGLPAGSGNTVRGTELYSEHCAGCHGTEGQGGAAMELVGDRSLLATGYPDKGIAVYWPWAPTLFEYIRRSMPPEAPYSLSTDETYAIVARLLELNDLVVSGQRIDAAVLAAIEMPNRDGFISDIE